MNRSSLSKLINSLDADEVIGFRKFVRSSKEIPGYIRVFDQLIIQKRWNDGTLRRKLGYTSKQLANLKFYLETRLTEYLTVTKGDQPIDLAKLSLLFLSRGLTKEAHRIILKGKKAAYEQENFGLLLELIEAQKRIGTRLRLNYLEEQAEVIQKLDNLIGFQNLRVRLQAALDDLSLAAPKISPIEEVRNSPLLQMGTPLLSKRAEYEYLKIKAKFAALSADYQGVEQFANKIVQLLEANRDIFPDRDQLMIRELSKLAHIHINYGFLIKANTLFEKIRSIPAQSMRTKALIFDQADFLDFSLAIDRGDVQIAQRLFPRITEDLNRYKSFLPSQKTDMIRYTLGYYHLLNLEFEEARKNVAYFERRGIKANTTIKLFAQLLSLTASLELGDFFALESDLSRVTRTFNLHSFGFELPKMWIRCIKDCFAIDTAPEKGIFAQYQNQIRKLRQSPTEKLAFDFFPADVWVEANLSGKNPFEVKKERWQKGLSVEQGESFLKTAY